LLFLLYILFGSAACLRSFLHIACWALLAPTDMLPQHQRLPVHEQQWDDDVFDDGWDHACLQLC